MAKEFSFKERNLSADWRWTNSDTFTFEFGEGELKDADGDECWLLCEYHKDTDKFIIQSWYEDAEAVLLFSDYKNAETYPFIFPLSKDEVTAIKAFMQSKGAGKE